MDGPAILHTHEVIWSDIVLCLHKYTLVVMLLTETVGTGAEIDGWDLEQEGGLGLWG